jgi:hypothetical protein
VLEFSRGRDVEVTYDWRGHPAGAGTAVLRQTASGRRWDTQAGGISTQGSFVVVDGPEQISARGCLWFTRESALRAEVSCSLGWAAGVESVADAMLTLPLGRQLVDRDVMASTAICYESVNAASSICVDGETGVPVYFKSGNQEMEAREVSVGATRVAFPSGVSLDKPWYADADEVAIAEIGLPAAFADALDQSRNAP